MFIHNLTVALRNLTKYKTQSIVSILGLAAGFACFSLTAMWIRYENSFDNFHPKGDRIYKIVCEITEHETGNYSMVPVPLAAYMKTNFPEVEETAIERPLFSISSKQNKECYISIIDSGFVKLFDLPNELFSVLNSTHSDITPCAITQSIASELLCDTVQNVIGMYIKSHYKNRIFEVRKILPDWKHSEIAFDGLIFDDIITNNYWNNDWNSAANVYVLLKEGIDEDAFIKKSKRINIKELDNNMSIHHVFTVIPLHDLRKKVPSSGSFLRTKYEHIRFFALAGTLVILSALFNYLVLFITRLKMRGRELALRKVNGATDKSLMKMLLAEFGLVLFLALLAGEYLVKISLPFFQKVSGTNIEQIEIYQETIIFAGILYIGTLLLCTLPIYYYRQRTLNEYLHGNFHGGIQNIFQKVMMTVQLLMSVIMILSTTVIFMQMRYLQNSSMGFNLHNMSSLYNSSYGTSIDVTPLVSAIEQLPYIDKVISLPEMFFPNETSFLFETTRVIQEGVNEEIEVKIDKHFTKSGMFDFLGIQILEGRTFNPDDINEIVINESARRLLCRKDVIGTQLNGHTIVGVVADCYVASPLLPAQPIVYYNYKDKAEFSFLGEAGFIDSKIIVKFKEGIDINKEIGDIGAVAKKIFPNFNINVPNWEEYYQRIYLSSEKNLAKLFSIVSIICLLISIFGIYSLASLTCEQRRKEIAIRKINGATMKDILNLFFKEFFILLGIAIFIAFPIGYYVMHLWLEQYSRQVPMGPLLFLGIALALALVIVMTIIFRVWRAASANPAQVIKENN